MTRRLGIDTSVLVLLITEDPEAEFEDCVEKLRSLVEDSGDEIFVSNQVIGEAYVAVQLHYGVTKAEARSSLLNTLQSGLVSPLNGPTVIAALEAKGGPGLFDRLIANDYARTGLEVLTLDRKMASLPDVNRL
ncbi:MAG: type II toxin-antitoxin system VapC family toxin [Gemmatimonadetes bacterium]|nr:type II toxin-antitoxin system VapC family toxin [Gemmatimonadota bacterium]MYD24308.1 type II toxin-antitoxin system VapC family toxin [Gemmatimonadota bacterium]